MNEVDRWKEASRAAGRYLQRWYQKHPGILSVIAPKLPTIITVLLTADIEQIEDMLKG